MMFNLSTHENKLMKKKIVKELNRNSIIHLKPQKEYRIQLKVIVS